MWRHFVGNANILTGTVERIVGEQALIRLSGGKVLVDTRGEALTPEEPVTLAVRSENILMDENCGCGLEAAVEEKPLRQVKLAWCCAWPTEAVVASRYGIDANVQVGAGRCAIVLRPRMRFW